MGDIADDMIERMQEEFYPRTYQLEAMAASRRRKHPPHGVNCRATMVPITVGAKAEEPKATPTHIVCSYCQKGGLHWGLDKGKPRLREEGGWIHDCPQVEGVSLSLPDVRTKR